MSAVLSLLFLVIVVWLLAGLERKGLLHTGGCPCCNAAKKHQH